LPSALWTWSVAGCSVGTQPGDQLGDQLDAEGKAIPVFGV
jgi:hypothetical protein